MAKKLSRREFLRLATMGTAYVGTGILLPGCQEAPDTVEPRTATTIPQVTPTLRNITSSNNTLSHIPLGKAQGVKPGRVVWAYNADATRWDGEQGYWWAAENTDYSAADEMVRQSLCDLAGQDDEVHAWAAMFEYFNRKRGKSNAGYQKGEKVAVKININTCNKYDRQHNNTFSSPQVIFAVLKQLVGVVGVDPADIVVYDAVRYVPDCIYELGNEKGLVGIHFADFAGERGREKCVPNPDCIVHWSEDTGGNVTYLPTCITEAQYLINMAGLKGHRLAGATLCAKNHCGTILAKLNGEPTMQSPQGANIHGFIAAKDYDQGPGWQWSKREMGSYNALVDMMGHQHLGGKTLLFVIDGLYATPHQQAEVTNAARWHSEPFNGHWTSSVFLSMDGVAIDSVAYDFLVNEPSIAGNPEVMPPGHTTENYLHEAAQAGAPDSLTTYCPDGEGYKITSLGVHEHWDDVLTRQYSRNRGDGEGIELVQVG
jgi:uncharacterized protein (DUF362 family)